MKKFVLSAIALTFATALFAIDPVVLDGNFNVKKAKGTLATYSISWDGLMISDIDEGELVDTPVPVDEYLAAKDKEKGTNEYTNDWKEIRKDAKSTFFEAWNHEFKKGLKLTEKDSEAGYAVALHITNLYFGHTGGVFSPNPKAGGAIIKGELVITDKATGEVVLRVKIQHVQGYANFSDRLRTIMAMNALVDEIEDAY